ncbi:MAG TPA: FkbM family methyltransferase [Bacteroidales bacterium]|nr:FkbM family methyltransferase [Bacteroidales bacterium]
MEVFKDASKDLFYVLQNGKKLYYSRHYTTMEAVQNSYCSLVAEQNPDSPHLYLKEGFQVNEGDFVVDLGAAEGNFSLDIVEKAGKIIIVEAENHWIEALNATFEPWQDKVEIIHKYISNINNDRCATLQSLVGNHPIDFLKLDVEGAEGDILNSSSDLLLRKQIRKLAVCTYHRKDDEKQFKLLFNKYDYEIVQTPGYMLFVYGKLTPPFFRKVMIQAVARY